VTLTRRRDPDVVLPTRVIAERQALELEFPAGWLDQHPMSHADLRQERAFLAAAGMTLRVTPQPTRTRAVR
jgi:exopolyphosphatase/guanosine-5'-triphosphate,3'-diphosphate pyrophosphatase